MDEVSTGGGFTSSSGGGMVGNPGAGFMNLLGIGTKSESVIIKGQDFDQMRNLAEDVKSYIDELSTVSNVSVNVQENSPEVHLLFDMDYINRNSFTLQNITSALATFGREYSSGATFKQGTESYDIIIKYADENG